MDVLKWVLALLFLLLFSAGSFYAIFRNYRHARRIEDTPTSNIDSAAQGYVELIGKAEGITGEPVRAPISGKECLWYRYTVEERKGMLPPERYEWRVIKRGVSKALFRLVDESGQCVVMPEGASVSGVPKTQWLGDTPDDSASALIGNMYRFTEELIHPQMPLYVIGHFATLSGVAGLPVVREPLQALLDEWKTNRDDLLLRTREGEEGLVPTTYHVIGQSDEATYPLLIATSRQNAAARHYRKLGVLSVGLFFLWGIWFLWLLQAGPS